MCNRRVGVVVVQLWSDPVCTKPTGNCRITEGLGFRENSYTQPSVAAFNAAVRAGGNSDSAALANRGLLKVANLPDGRPEGINSFEVGYKSVTLNNRLLIDLDAYFAIYDGFLGQVQVLPGVDTTGTDAYVYRQLPAAGDSVRIGQPIHLWVGPQGHALYGDSTNVRN